MDITILQLRARVFALIREFFALRGFTEVDTPALVPLPSQEPYLSPMEVNFPDVHGKSLNWYLATSPEFAIKKLLAEGARNVYQLSHVFRGGEAFGGTHHPEFMMLEWYRTPGDYNDIMRDTEELICYIIKELDPRLREDDNGAGGAGAGTPLARKPTQSRLSTCGVAQVTGPAIMPFHRLTVAQAFKEYANLETTNFSEADWIDTAKKFGHTVATADDAFFALFLNLVENKLPQEQPTFITDYPLFQAALAKKSTNNPNVAERCELYWGGLELANGFSELTDADEQLRRFQAEQKIKQALGKKIIPIDPAFIAALKKGFPPTGGIALGVDRLLMVLTGVKEINTVLPFSAK